MPRTKQRTPQLRNRVVDVAVDLITREGVARFTTRNIAREANTSLPAVYELFGDKSGLVREVFFAGFRLLRTECEALRETANPRADLLRLVATYRSFVVSNPVLAEVMFSRPFRDFAPGPGDLRAGAFVQNLILRQVRRCIDAGLVHGDEIDIAHVLIALAQGLAATESSGRLGGTQRSTDRRWTLALDALLNGLGDA